MRKGTTLKSNIEKIYGDGPKQYQQGWTEFYKLKFKLTPDVLIPRPETELLVDEAIKSTKTPTSDPHPPTFLDIGTGSGAISISIAKNLPNAKVVAIDISENALKIAEQNAAFHKVENQIIFLKSDLLSFLQPPTSNPQPFHIIIANLPYIPTARLMLIDPMVTEFEPKIALDGGRDGFELYRRLFAQMVEKKVFPRLLIAEIDAEHTEVALAEARKYFPNAKAEIKKDLAKLDRILIIHF
jgi:release factor glutamine methyltransferase